MPTSVFSGRASTMSLLQSAGLAIEQQKELLSLQFRQEKLWILGQGGEAWVGESSKQQMKLELEQLTTRWKLQPGGSDSENSPSFGSVPGGISHIRLSSQTFAGCGSDKMTMMIPALRGKGRWRVCAHSWKPRLLLAACPPVPVIYVLGLSPAPSLSKYFLMPLKNVQILLKKWSSHIERGLCFFFQLILCEEAEVCQTAFSSHSHWQ